MIFYVVPGKGNPSTQGELIIDFFLQIHPRIVPLVSIIRTFKKAFLIKITQGKQVVQSFLRTAYGKIVAGLFRIIFE